MLAALRATFARSQCPPEVREQAAALRRQARPLETLLARLAV